MRGVVLSVLFVALGGPALSMWLMDKVPNLDSLMTETVEGVLATVKDDRPDVAAGAPTAALLDRDYLAKKLKASDLDAGAKVVADGVAEQARSLGEELAKSSPGGG